MLKKLLSLIALIVLGVGVLLPAVSSAGNYGKGSYGTCQYGSCGITIGTGTTVNINVTPTPTGQCTIASDSVTVTTYNSNGYTLTLSDTTTNTSLVSGANSIVATTGTQASPAALAVSSWGYRVDGVGGFGAGPTTSATNVTPPAVTFAGVPSSAAPNTLLNTSAPAGTGQTTSVWYGVCANTTVINGAYTSQVTYSAVTN